jgi:hypothetical protein
MTIPGSRRDPAAGQRWMFLLLFVLFVAASVWWFHTGQTVGASMAAAVALLDLGAATALHLRSRRTRRS